MSYQKSAPPNGNRSSSPLGHRSYRSRLDLAGLPAAAARQIDGSVFVGVQLAQHDDSPALLDSARNAFSHGMDVALVASAGFALVGALLALAFLPAWAKAPDLVEERAHVPIG